MKLMPASHYGTPSLYCNICDMLEKFDLVSHDFLDAGARHLLWFLWVQREVLAAFGVGVASWLWGSGLSGSQGKSIQASARSERALNRSKCALDEACEEVCQNVPVSGQRLHHDNGRGHRDIVDLH